MVSVFSSKVMKITTAVFFVYIGFFFSLVIITNIDPCTTQQFENEFESQYMYYYSRWHDQMTKTDAYFFGDKVKCHKGKSVC